MVLFASDLDNTLIYSHKREIGKEKICVERYQGREVSFITKRSQELLREIKRKVCFVPTTTRSVEQYKRIYLDGDWKPKYALVCNGGILLVNDKIDQGWYKESLKLIEGCKEQLERAAKILEKDKYRNFEIRKISELFVFTKTEQAEFSIKRLKEELEGDMVDILSNGVKIYVVPKVLKKGNAVERLKRKLGADFVIAAGDSKFDISMLETADISFFPEELEKESIKGKKSIMVKETIFSDILLEYIKNKKKE